MIRKIGLILAAFLVAGAVSAPSALHAVSSDPDAVHWKADYDNQTITVDLNLDFWMDCAAVTFAPHPASCAGFISPRVSQVADAITGAWNGHYFKCFKFILQLHARAVETQADVASDAVGIEFRNDMAADNQAFSTTHHKIDPLSNDPSHHQVPLNDPADPSHWALMSDPSTYIHETGHLLGLDDNYDENDPGNGYLLKGAVPDAMYGNGPHKAEVSQDMIDRVVIRSNKVEVSKVKCAMTMDAGPANSNFLIAHITGETLHAYTCDYQPVTTDPKDPPKPMHFTGKLSFGGDWLGHSGSKTIDVSFDVTVPAIGTGRATIKAATGLAYAADFRWTGDGLIHSARPFTINGFPTEEFTVAPGDPAFIPVVTRGAPECKK